jgi:glycosyltransferase involved in cell wall biosynthesis
VFHDRLRFPAERIRVVPNGVEVPETPLPRGDAVGSLSLLEPVKDLATFLDAAAILAARRPQVPFVVFGEGSERSSLERHARDLGIEDRVEFPGYVDRAVALRRLAVLVLPSVVENAPMALLEAMAAGIPVVASRAGGIPEITGEEAASLVQPGDAEGFALAIGQLLDDRQLAEERAAAARGRVRSSFTNNANVAATIRIYEEALAKRRTTSR